MLDQETENGEWKAKTKRKPCLEFGKYTDQLLRQLRSHGNTCLPLGTTAWTSNVFPGGGIVNFSGVGERIFSEGASGILLF